MALPLAGIAAGATVVGGGLSIAGLFGRSAAQKKISDLNARLYELQATYTREATVEELRRHRLGGEALLSTQTAGFAASGVRTSEGSPLEVMYRTVGELETERRWIQRSGDTKAQMSQIQADIARVSGKTAMQNLPFEVGGTLVSSLAQGTAAYANLGGLKA